MDVNGPKGTRFQVHFDVEENENCELDSSAKLCSDEGPEDELIFFFKCVTCIMISNRPILTV